MQLDVSTSFIICAPACKVCPPTSTSTYPALVPHIVSYPVQPYLGRVLPAILDGLADESEGVRAAALSAGERG